MKITYIFSHNLFKILMLEHCLNFFFIICGYELTGNSYYKYLPLTNHWHSQDLMIIQNQEHDQTTDLNPTALHSAPVYSVKKKTWDCVKTIGTNNPQGEKLLFNVKWAIFQQYHGENKLLFNKMTSALYYRPTR